LSYLYNTIAAQKNCTNNKTMSQKYYLCVAARREKVLEFKYTQKGE